MVSVFGSECRHKPVLRIHSLRATYYTNVQQCSTHTSRTFKTGNRTGASPLVYMPFDALKLKLSCADERTFEFEIRHGENRKSDILLKLQQEERVERAPFCKLASRITPMQITVCNIFDNIFDKQKGGHTGEWVIVLCGLTRHFCIRLTIICNIKPL